MADDLNQRSEVSGNYLLISEMIVSVQCVGGLVSSRGRSITVIRLIMFPPTGRTEGFITNTFSHVVNLCLFICFTKQSAWLP